MSAAFCLEELFAFFLIVSLHRKTVSGGGGGGVYRAGIKTDGDTERGVFLEFHMSTATITHPRQ